MEPRLVDERDTQWEIDTPRLRIFLRKSEGFQDTFDTDTLSLAEAEAWAERELGSSEGTFGIAVRTEDTHGRPGLIWLRA